MLTLADLEPHVIEVSIHIVEGDETSRRIVPMKMLSYSEWWEIGLSVDDPDLPEPIPKKVNGVKKMVVDKEDPDYQLALVQAQNERHMRRLAASLIGGGNFVELKDKPIVEQAKTVSKLPHSFLQGLMAALNRLHRMSHSEVMAKSENFLRVRDSEGDGDDAAGDNEPESVVGVAANGAG